MNAENTHVLLLADQQCTRELGAAIAHAVARSAVVALAGPLGAGKTTLVQGLAQALAVKETVNSPTFTMLNEYHSGRLPLYHLDLYRISEDGKNFLDTLLVELEELLEQDAITIIEWADLLMAEESKRNIFAQLDHLVVRLSYFEEVKASKAVKKNFPSFYIENARKAELSAYGEKSIALLSALKKTFPGFIKNP